MMVATHTVMSCALTSLALGTADPLVLGLAAIAAQLPDVDTSKSVPGRVLFPLAHFLENRFPHRSITHSFLASVIVAVLCLPVVYWNSQLWTALVLGYFLGWFGDVFTKSGVTAFYPSASRLVIPGNPRLRLSTNSPAEVFVLGILIGVLVISLLVNSSGGILRSFNQILGTAGGAVEIVNAENSRYLLFARIRGTRQLTSEPVNETFEVVKALTQTDLLVKDNQGRLYRAGTTQEGQILVSQEQIERGPKIVATVKEVVFTGEGVSERLQGISLERTYLSGDLKLENGGDLQVLERPLEFSPITVQFTPDGAIAHLESASPTEVVKLLDGYPAYGSLIVRSINVRT